MRRHIRIVLLLFICSTKMFSQQLAFGTDVMSDVLMTPNIGCEMVIGNRSTLGINAFGNFKPWGQDIKMLGIQPEYRYYLSGRPMHEAFIGLGGIATSYDISWKGKTYEGTGLGAGITFGYVFNITDRLNIDAHAGFGVISYEQKEFYKHDDYLDLSTNDVTVANAKGYYLLPTRIGISITYIIR